MKLHILSFVVGVSALQFCQVDPVHQTDICLAVTTARNVSTGKNDLSMHMAVDFPNRNGWVAVGLGEEMSGALMFVMYPGVKVGEMTVSVRTINGWAPPQGIDGQSEPTPAVVVVSQWLESLTGIHHSMFMCYDCESWSSSAILLNSTSQPWIWASGPNQKTQSDNRNLPLTIHDIKGIKYINMGTVFEPDEGIDLAQITSPRISWPPGDISDTPMELGMGQKDKTPDHTPMEGPGDDPTAGITPEPDTTPEPSPTPDTSPISTLSINTIPNATPGPSTIPVPSTIPTPNMPTKAKHQYKHNLIGIVSIHGILAALSFFTLSLGTVCIRSGFAKSFKLHWVLQAIGGIGVVIGCLMGLYISYAHGRQFNSFHQWIGLLILPTMILQALFGYWHHINFVKYHSRTSVSNYHIWIGRVVLIVGNVNVFLGLNLIKPFLIERVAYYTVISLQAMALLPMWYFWSREGKTAMDVVRGQEQSANVQYTSVMGDGGENDAFIVGGVGDEYELDEEEELGLRGDESEGETEYRKEKH